MSGVQFRAHQTCRGPRSVTSGWPVRGPRRSASVGCGGTGLEGPATLCGTLTLPRTPGRRGKRSAGLSAARTIEGLDPDARPRVAGGEATWPSGIPRPTRSHSRILADHTASARLTSRTGRSRGKNQRSSALVPRLRPVPGFAAGITRSSSLAGSSAPTASRRHPARSSPS